MDARRDMYSHFLIVRIFVLLRLLERRRARGSQDDNHLEAPAIRILKLLFLDPNVAMKASSLPRTAIFVAFLIVFSFIGYCSIFHALPNIGNRSVAIDGKLNEKKRLPSFDNGGVVFFLHVPKSGGTTIRKHIKRRSYVEYLFSENRATFSEMFQSMARWVNSGPRHGQIKVLEVHARNNPTIIELCQQLHEWRALAKQNDVPFFAFTILRDPLSFATSYFNYYHGKRWEKRRFEFLPAVNMTEDNFLRTMHFNPQCLFLTRSEQSYQKNFPQKRQNLTKRDCDAAYHCLQSNMDWIGTTGRLRNETIPLLNHLIDLPYRLANRTDRDCKNVKDENGSHKFYSLQNASTAAFEYLETMTEWDREVYERSQKDFVYDDFDLP